MPDIERGGGLVNLGQGEGKENKNYNHLTSSLLFWGIICLLFYLSQL